MKIDLHRRPILMHSRFMTVDDDIAVIGSSAMDMRSFQLSLEVTFIWYDHEVVTDCRAAEEYYLQRCKPIRLHEWRARPLSSTLFENVCRLTSALQ